MEESKMSAVSYRNLPRRRFTEEFKRQVSAYMRTITRSRCVSPPAYKKLDAILARLLKLANENREVASEKVKAA